MSQKPLLAASGSATPTLANLWVAETPICIPSNTWRWTDTGFLALFIAIFLFTAGLVCQDADLIAQLVDLKEGKWVREITDRVMQYFDEGARQDALQRYIRKGLTDSKRRLKKEIKDELRIEYVRLQRKRAAQNAQHASASAPHPFENTDEYAERVPSMNGERGWGSVPVQRSRTERPSQAGDIVSEAGTRLVRISEAQARDIAQATTNSI
jgi:hypothetical protein